jgi:7,8-dihydropterin-6-yl-methyl-4-(beta-D-ribofuranosyl)aminobenzene 5'-phosphate synthase
MKKTTSGYIQDDFAHEQNLIITVEGKIALFSGCSHKGITNILRTAQKHHPDIKAVFDGFHLYNPATRSAEPIEVVQGLAKEISSYKADLYTCHCTGQQAYGIIAV